MVSPIFENHFFPDPLFNVLRFQGRTRPSGRALGPAPVHTSSLSLTAPLGSTFVFKPTSPLSPFPKALLATTSLFTSILNPPQFCVVSPPHPPTPEGERNTHLPSLPSAVWKRLSSMNEGKRDKKAEFRNVHLSCCSLSLLLNRPYFACC